MTPIMTTKDHSPQVADIFRAHIADYQNAYRLWPEHKKIVTDLLNCRTQKLGGQIERCDHCGTLRITYHSCRNRHCPKCQHMPRERWLEKRQAEILPTSYFHVVFTLPHELNTIILNNKKPMLNTLFKAASTTLLDFAKNELNATAGFLAILHTWDQNLKAHFHLHCLLPAGAFSKHDNQWIACQNDYLFNQDALSLVFRGKFIDFMGQACQNHKLKLDTQAYQKLKNTLFEKKWVVSVRDPVKRADDVLQYLARYTHRVAIANSRIKQLKEGMVTFSAKNRKKNCTDDVTISAVQFIHRFLLHSLPKGFVRIRYYGFLANRHRSENLSTIRLLLGISTPMIKTDMLPLEEMMQMLTGIDITLCPCCKKGKMKVCAQIPRYRARAPNRLDGMAA